jgi:hypothetical protein
VVIAASSPPFATVTITTLISIVTLVSLIAGIYATLMQARANRKSIASNHASIVDTKEAVDNNQAKIEDVHAIVNSRYDDLVKYVQVLSEVLKAADIKVPSFQRAADVAETVAKEMPKDATT